jgi:hypothetical protein
MRTDAAGAVKLHAAPDAPADTSNRTSGDAAADALVSELRRVADDLRQDRDHWRSMAERLSLAAPEKPKPSLWRWLRTY